MAFVEAMDGGGREVSERADELLLGRILVRLGHLPPEKVSGVLAEQEKSGDPLGEILLRQGLLSKEALAEALKLQREALAHKPYTNAAGASTLFGEHVKKLGLATADQVNAALRVQGQTWEKERIIRNLGEILIEQGAMELPQFLSVLQSQGKALGACQVCWSRFNIPTSAGQQARPVCTVCGGPIERLRPEAVRKIYIRDDLSGAKRKEG